MHRGRAFTIVEMILIIAMVGVLLALLAPGMGRSLDSARRTRTLSQLGQHGRVLAAYSSEWNDSFPAFLDPDATSHVIRYGGGRVETVPLYFLAHATWHFALADGYYNSDPLSPVFYPAEQVSRFGSGGTPLVLSCSLFARPEYWSAGTRQCAGQLGATRTTEIQHASSKAVMLSVFWAMTDANNAPLSGRGITANTAVPVLAADGAGLDRALRHFRPGVTTGESPCPSMVHPWDVWVGMHTEGGVRGRDLN